MSTLRTQQFRGRSPPDRDGWQVPTVARRTTNHDGSAVCAVTGETVPLTETHFYVTLRRQTSSLTRSDEYESLIVVDGALGELDEWLEDGEE
ncbi:hypothetical protein [Natrinema sp. DC36]|uniref:hypothetical protein n=1 Tax=Natrinema sp. DC36 TaxID=2878680 RepID=UPI001CF0D32A|nr:hypothetical protein [Natrinema sp. DC36]